MKTIALICALLFSGSVVAENTYFLGVGNLGCGQWIKSHKGTDEVSKAEQFAQGQWVLGYLSGTNLVLSMRDKPMVRLPDWDSMTASMNKFCAAKPSQAIVLAGMDLYLELARRQGVKDPY